MYKLFGPFPWHVYAHPACHQVDMPVIADYLMIHKVSSKPVVLLAIQPTSEFFGIRVQQHVEAVHGLGC